MTILRVNTIAGTGTTFGPTLSGNLEFNSQNYVVLPKGTSTQEGVLRTTADVVGTGGTYYDNLVLAMPFNEATGFTDVSSRNRNPAAYGNVAISTAQSKYYGSSAYFDGDGDYLSIAVGLSSDFVLSNYNYTIEFWFNAVSTTNADTLFSIGNVGSLFADLVTIEFQESGRVHHYVGAIGIGGGDVACKTNNTITTNTWNHIAVQRNINTWTMYLNGVAQTTSNTSSATISKGDNVYIGTSSFDVSGRTSNAYLQDLRIYKGLAKYTANFTPPERIAEIGVGFKAGQLRYNTDSNKVELYDGSQWTEVQSSRPDLNGGARGVFGGGRDGAPTFVIQNTIDYITISTTGNAQDFGDLTAGRRLLGSCSSNTRGVFAGGINPSSVYENTIDFITIASTGNASDFGDLTQARLGASGCSSSTRGLFGGGYLPGTITVNTIDYITIASTGNAVDFGDRTLTIRYSGACSSSIRGVWGGGNSPSNVNIIEFVTISTIGNAFDFGDLTVARGLGSSCASPTRGVFAGGLSPTALNTIDYITIATTGNAINFGELTQSRGNLAATSSSTRGVFGGGYTPTVINTIDYINISTQGNAIDFGDLLVVRNQLSSCSNAHGGL